MLAFFVISATLHLLLGAAIAVVLSHDLAELTALLPQISLRRAKKPAEAPHAEQTEENPAASAPEPPSNPADVIPESWRNAALEPRSPAEGAMWFVHGRAAAMREKLFAIDRTIRAEAATAVIEHVRETYRKSLEFLAVWSDELKEVSQTLEAKLGKLTKHDEFARRFNEEMLDHISRIASIRERINGELMEDGPQESLRRLRDDLILALAAVEQIKAQSENEHAIVRNRDHALKDIAEDILGGGELQLYTRLGAENRFTAWCEEDPERTRPLCGAAVRLDRVEKFRDHHGMEATERLTQSLAEVVASSLRRKRGDFAVSIDPATIFMFLANSPAREGKNAAERVRQTIEATEFRIGGESISLTICCAVCEPTLDDGPGDLIERLNAGLDLVHRSGGNRTAVDEGNGAALIDPIVMEVKARTVDLN